MYARWVLLLPALLLGIACKGSPTEAVRDGGSEASAPMATLAERCSRACRTRALCPAPRGLYNPAPEADIDKLLERKRQRLLAVEPDCVRLCAATPPDKLERCLSSVEKHWLPDGGRDDACESWFGGPCTDALPHPMLPDGTWGTCTRTDGCAEYHGSALRNPVYAAEACEDVGLSPGKFSTGGCPRQGLVGICVLDAGLRSEQHMFHYASGKVTAAKLKEQCLGTWLNP